ncbi:MAG: sigma-70 family RNA polymerase sigma factor [Bryobacterales bacterium]|jgi:RNA polymerase sigma-70 factor (ECF subfamily)|nr:sigma-70 family RNA polymerase sigma factor [Bryobacterales bacterium]
MSGPFPKAEARSAEFEAVAVPHLRDLYRAALAFFRNPAEAEDVIQEVYVEAWRSFSRFEPGTNCRAWLYKILMHKASHHRRHWFRRMKQAQLDEPLVNTLQAQPEIPATLTDAELLSALGRLPEAYRAILLLADVEEFSYKEIAAMQEIPIGTVMSRLSRARAALRRELGSDGNADGSFAKRTGA